MESSSALSGGLFSYAPDTFCSNDATFVEARENENMVLVLHSTGSCKRNAVLLGACFILKGHENGAITGHNGHENGAITGQKDIKVVKYCYLTLIKYILVVLH